MAKQTMTEKIIARHAGKKRVRPGEIVWVEADLLLTHDVCGPGTIGIFREEFGSDARVWDRQKVIIIPDHFIFTDDPQSAANLEVLRRFAGEQQIEHFYDVGSERYAGVCHVAMAERGLGLPGQILFGTDSHTCTAGAFGLLATGVGNTDAAFVMGTGRLWVRVPSTLRIVLEGRLPPYLMAKDLILAVLARIGVEGASYRAMEFCGSAVSGLGMPERMTLCNMAIEAGAKSGIVEVDQTCREFLAARTRASFEEVQNDQDAVFEAEQRFSVETLLPMVAKPHSPGNAVPISEVEGTPIDRCYIGSCTGGKTEDLLRAAEILEGRRVVVETYVVPATTAVDAEIRALQKNGRSVYQILSDAGAKIGPPSCAACLGGPKGTFGRLTGGEVCLSTTNRNFPGRMGSAAAQVFLSSPYTAAASALTGTITDPRKYLV